MSIVISFLEVLLRLKESFHKLHSLIYRSNRARLSVGVVEAILFLKINHKLWAEGDVIEADRQVKQEMKARKVSQARMAAAGANFFNANA